MPRWRGWSSISAQFYKRRMHSDCEVELEPTKQEVKRKALGLLGIIGLTPDDLTAGKMKHEGKGDDNAFDRFSYPDACLLCLPAVHRAT